MPMFIYFILKLSIISVFIKLEKSPSPCTFSKFGQVEVEIASGECPSGKGSVRFPGVVQTNNLNVQCEICFCQAFEVGISSLPRKVTTPWYNPVGSTTQIRLTPAGS